MTFWPSQMWDGGVCITHCYPYLFFELLTLALCFGLAMVTRRWTFVPVAALIAGAFIIAVESIFRVVVLGEAPFAYLEYLLQSGWDGLPGLAIGLAILSLVILIFFGIKRALIWAVIGDASFLPRAAVGAVTLVLLLGIVFASVFALAPSLVPRRIAERAADLTGQAPSRCGPQSARPVKGLPAFRGLPRPEGQRVLVVSRDRLHNTPSIYTTEMAFQHLLTRPRPLRASNPEAFGDEPAVGLELSVGSDGRVQAIAVAGGPPALHRQAISMASGWRFVPFVRDGRPADVVLRRARIAIDGPELWAWPRASFPRFSDWDSIDIRVKLFGYKHGFELIVRGDGSVTFEGHGEDVALHGRHCAVVPRESLMALVDAFRRANFFSMRDYYTSSDESGYVSIALDDYVKRVEFSGGDREEAPESLWHVVDAALASVHADRWIKGDAFTGPSLAAERWDFASDDISNTNLLARVAKFGDLEAVRALLALGAPVATAPRRPKPTGWWDLSDPIPTALHTAADRGARDIVQFLLASNVRWGGEALDGAYVSAIQYGDRAMMDMLRARGVSARPQGIRGKTDLMAAAIAGDHELVAQLLRAGRDPNDVDDVQLTALHWAAVADYPKAVESEHADRRRVIELLVRAGGGVNARGHMEWTPLISNWTGHEAVTKALIAHGADVNLQDEDGRTALMTNLNPRATEILLAAGADPRLRNGRGQNALEVARADVFAGEVVTVLERWMARHPVRSGQ
jgi:ankyrin repeat protein